MPFDTVKSLTTGFPTYSPNPKFALVTCTLIAADLAVYVSPGAIPFTVPAPLLSANEKLKLSADTELPLNTTERIERATTANVPDTAPGNSTAIRPSTFVVAERVKLQQAAGRESGPMT